MKIPRSMYYFTDAEVVRRPDTLLCKAARALEIEASFHRKQKNKEATWALRLAADALYAVAEGKTFAQAFDWPAQVNAEREKS